MYYGKGGIKATKPIFLTVTSEGITFNRKRSTAVKETARTLKLSHNRPISLATASNEEKLAFVDLLLEK